MSPGRSVPPFGTKISILPEAKIVGIRSKKLSESH
jgi:hypothetical protein